jgi:hypothetical protein
MGERNAAPQGHGPAAEKQAEGVRTGNEKLQDKGQRGENVTTDRHDGTFVGGKDRMPTQPQGAAGGGNERHVVETGMPADVLEEDDQSETKPGSSTEKKGGLDS